MITINNKFEIGQKVLLNFDFKTRFFIPFNFEKNGDKIVKLSSIQENGYGFIETIATDGKRTIYNVSCYYKNGFGDYQLYDTIPCFENELKDMGE